MTVKVVLECLPGSHTLMRTTWTSGLVMTIVLGTITWTQIFALQLEYNCHHFTFTYYTA